ncbi:hypothetical protein I312_105815 [Cryptococcus bacillisporus CA1280]|uniref:uncharacterized protein n=1 Tax=Cryptococcus bacillisporus CA1280 TaxID=1296109 RepID=UPI003368481C
MGGHSGTITPFAHTGATKFRIQNYVYDCILIFISVIRYHLRLSSCLSFPPSPPRHPSQNSSSSELPSSLLPLLPPNPYRDSVHGRLPII